MDILQILFFHLVYGEDLANQLRYDRGQAKGILN